MYDFHKSRNNRLINAGFKGVFDSLYPEINKGIYAVYTDILQEFDRYRQANKPFRGIYINGSFGTGKTSLLALIADALITFGYKVEYITATDYIEAVRYKDYECVELMKNTDILIIDNLGWGVSFENEINAIVELLRDRYDRSRSSIIASNLKLEKVAENAKKFEHQYRQLLSYFNDEQKYSQIILASDSIREQNKEEIKPADINNSILRHLPQLEA